MRADELPVGAGSSAPFSRSAQPVSRALWCSVLRRFGEGFGAILGAALTPTPHRGYGADYGAMGRAMRLWCGLWGYRPMGLLGYEAIGLWGRLWGRLCGGLWGYRATGLWGYRAMRQAMGLWGRLWGYGAIGQAMG